jgi:hypothetical protein
VYLLTRANTLLWAEVLVGESKADFFGVFHSTEFRTELLKCPFPAVKAVVQALVDIDTDGGCSTEALSIVEYLGERLRQDKTARA